MCCLIGLMNENRLLPSNHEPFNANIAKSSPAWRLLLSCATNNAVGDNSPPSVRKINSRLAPEMKDSVEHTRKFCDETYPKIVGLLVEDASNAPRQFTIKFKKHLWNDVGGEVFGDRMYLSSH